MIYVRWQMGQSRRGRVYPKPAIGSEWADVECADCTLALKVDEMQLLIVGPTNPEDNLKHVEGRWYAGRRGPAAQAVHGQENRRRARRALSHARDRPRSAESGRSVHLPALHESQLQPQRRARRVLR